MTNPTAAMLVIGDEILSGRTRDSNMHHLAKVLTEAGIDLRESRVISDDRAAIVAAVQALSEAYTYVFTSGGIGPTHDDITAEAVAAAFDTPIGVREDARAILAEHYAKRDIELNEARLRMARIPEGATLIDNPVSAAPGFVLHNVHVMAGVPSIFEAMLAGVISSLAHGAPLVSETWNVLRGEGDVAEPLSKIAQDFPDLSVGSYPFQSEGRHGTNLVVRGRDPSRVEAAMDQLRGLFPA